MNEEKDLVRKMDEAFWAILIVMVGGYLALWLGVKLTTYLVS